MFKVIALYDKKQTLPDDDIYYIITKKGIMLRKKVGLIDALIPVKNISFLQNKNSYININLPKISYSLFSKIVSFFKAVFEKYQTESIVMLYMDRETKKYYIHVPEQKVSKTSVNYDRNVSFPDKLLVGTIHSHCDFGAFHSGIDVDDEKTMDGVHITVGKLNNTYYNEVVCSVVCNGHRIKKDPSEYINIKCKQNKLFFIIPKDFPIYWMDMINYDPPVTNFYNISDSEKYYNFYGNFNPYFNYEDYEDIYENNKIIKIDKENDIKTKNDDSIIIDSIREKYISKISDEKFNNGSFMEIYNSIEDVEKTYLKDHICKDCRLKDICITKCPYFRSLALRNHIKNKYGKGDVIERL